MCELCEILKKAEAKRSLAIFRLQQMQVDIDEGRLKEAKEAKELSRQAFADFVDLAEEHAQKAKEKGGDELPLSMRHFLSSPSDDSVH